MNDGLVENRIGTRVRIENKATKGGPSKATQLVEMALDRFRLGRSSDGMPFAVETGGPNVALSLRGRGGLRSVLAASFYESTGAAPGQNALSEALAVLEGIAAGAGREPIAIRTAEFKNKIVVDLGRADGEVAVIAPGTWTIVERSPVLFRSTEAVGELPIPVSGGQLGHLGRLRPLLHLSDEDWPVLMAFMVSALMSGLAHPVAFFTGEQGTSKSWASRLVVRTFDGSATDVQSAPRNEDDWAVVASSSWTVAIDNISRIDPWLSDAICRASTGAMWRKRALFTDDSVSILRVKRVVVLNGIEPEVTRGDLAERLVRFDLFPITERKSDEEIETVFKDAHPEILGALCDLTAKVLEVLPTTTVTDPPRMASFARVVAAVDDVLGTSGLERYRVMVKSQVAHAAEGDLFSQALERYLTATGGLWEGSSSGLLSGLRQGHDDNLDVPKTPQAVGSALSRAATSLRAKGWTVNKLHSGSRAWRIALPTKSEDAGSGVQGVQGGGCPGGVDTLDSSALPDPVDASIELNGQMNPRVELVACLI